MIGLLEHHFGRLVDYGFTAAMEDELDSIASGTDSRTAWLNGFYFGGAQGSEGSVARAGGLKKLVGVNLEEIDAREINSIPMFDDVVVRVGRYGPCTSSGSATGCPSARICPTSCRPTS